MHGVGTQVQPILRYPNLCTWAAASAQRKHLFPLCTKMPEKPAASVLNKALHNSASCFLFYFIHSLFQKNWPPRSSLPRHTRSSPGPLPPLPPLARQVFPQISTQLISSPPSALTKCHFFSVGTSLITLLNIAILPPTLSCP